MNDESWDYYLATGEDPTGGRIGPDFAPETGEYYDDEDSESVTESKASAGMSTLEDWIEDMLERIDNLSKRK
mgnify:CR=1 FL=1